MAGILVSKGASGECWQDRGVNQHDQRPQESCSASLGFCILDAALGTVATVNMSASISIAINAHKKWTRT
jgi:hypothetical protein